jgi:aminocarboxymuconate-semialdehyde decarboxylase
VASLILEGVLEQLPGLKIVISHGGGYLPHYFGRLDRNVTNMPESVRNISRVPSSYLRNLYYDTCVYDVSILEALVDRVGPDRLVLGSDYPVGDEDHLEFVRQARNLSEADLAALTGGTAAALLDLQRVAG